MSEPLAESQPLTSDRAPWWCAAAIVAAAVAAYANSFHGPFVFDDASSIVTNPTIRELWAVPGALSPPTTNVTAQGRPILNLSLAVNYAAGGTSVFGYHLVNLLIHAAAGLALFGVVRRLLNVARRQRSAVLQPARDRAASSNPARAEAPRYDRQTAAWLATAVAVLWTVHPLQTESVTYIIQRAESLVGLFYLLTVYAFVRGVGKGGSETRPTWWLGVSVVACLIGMATKEVMATAPLMVLFLDRTLFAGTFLGALRQRRGYYFALAGTWLLLAWLVAGTGGNRGGSVGFGVGVSAIDYWLTQFKAIGAYLWLSFWPHPLVFEYGSFWIRGFDEIAVQVALVFGLLGATVFALWRRSAWGFLGAWFFGILAPTSLAPGTTQMIVEHRMYLPLAAVILAVMLIWYGLLGTTRGRWLAAAIAAVGVAFVLVTVRRNHDYRSEIALWSDTIVKRPKNPLAHFMLAGALEKAGRLKEAEASYETALELKPDFSVGHENFGQLLLRQGRPAEAIPHFEWAARLQPEYADAHSHLGIAYLAVDRIAEAVGHLEKAAQLAPKTAVIRYNYGNALTAAGLTAEAVEEFQAAVRADPGLAAAHFNLANALAGQDRPAEAITHYQAAIKARPDFPAAHYNLANLLAGSGRQAEAVPHYEAALRGRSDYVEAHHNLGSALFELGRLAEAEQHYESTLRLAPDFPSARQNLERVRERMRQR